MFKIIGCTLKEDQPLRLPLNFFFHYFNCSEPAYKSHVIYEGHTCDCCVQSVKPECSKLDIVNNVTDFKMFQGCMNMWKGHLIFWGDLTDHVLLKTNF